MFHIFRKRVGMQSNFRVIVFAQKLRTFERDGAVAERGPLGAAGDDTDVEGHVVKPSEQWLVVRKKLSLLWFSSGDSTTGFVVKRRAFARLDSRGRVSPHFLFSFLILLSCGGGIEEV
jgi:hypothetical protein